jgi:glucose/arabinose dehydrogenase
MRIQAHLWFGVGLVLLVATPAAAQLRAEVYDAGFDKPVAFVTHPVISDVHYVVEKGGRIKITSTPNWLPFGGRLGGTVLDLSSEVSTGDEQGLLGLAFAPDFATSGRLYVNFTNLAGNTVIARFKIENLSRFDAPSRFDLVWPGGQRFIAQPFANHNGGHLAFGPDGYLYVGLGDGGAANDPLRRAQYPGTLLGKMLRIDVNVPDSDPEGYDVPPDNPFVGVPGVLPEIWSFGLRNPWRYSFDDPRLGGTGALVIGDVGQSTREEIDYEPARRGGRNYGWPNREGTVNNVTSSPPAYVPLTDPVFDYGRDLGSTVVGGVVYRGRALGAAYRGRYFFADFGLGRLYSLGLSIGPDDEAMALNITDHTVEITATTPLGPISSFGVDASGELFLTSFNGTILRIGSRQSNPVLQIAPVAEPRVNPLPVQVVTQPFVLSGYALDLYAPTGTGVNTVHVWAFQSSGAPPVFVGADNARGHTPGLIDLYGLQFRYSGFSLAVSGLAPGRYTLAVFAWLNAIRDFGAVQTVDVTVASGTLLAIDLPFNGASVAQPFHLAGWSIDAGDPSGTGVDTVHVWAYPVSAPGSPIFVGVPLLGGVRPDVGAFYGSPRFIPSGYNMLVSGLAPGTYDIVVYSHSTVTNSFSAAQVVRVAVR